MKLLNLMWSQSFMGLVNTRHSIYWDRMIPHFGWDQINLVNTAMYKVSDGRKR